VSQQDGLRDRRRVLAALAAGEVVLLQTDTLPGLHARLDRPAALTALVALKGRSAAKPFLVIAGSLAAAQALTRPWSRPVVAYLQACWPGPVTVILPAADQLPRQVTGERETLPGGAVTSGPVAGPRTVAVRVPAPAALRQLLAESGPLASTSANRAGQPAAADLAAAVARFPHLPAWNPQPAQAGVAASALVDLTGAEPCLLRPGPVALPDWPGAV